MRFIITNTAKPRYLFNYFLREKDGRFHQKS